MATEIGSIQPNPYLFNIENRRKQRARLAHEIGAGAPCFKCGDKCPGFQLHFWRKLCQNCRCTKDDHDVEDEEEDIGNIVIGKIFERPIRTKEEENSYSYGTDLEIVDEGTGLKEKVRFDWIPPGVEASVAQKYMQLLPQENRPVAGSEAARQRRRQLASQLPLYDVDANERSDDLPPEEMRLFNNFLHDLRTRVAGQGSVRQIETLMPLLQAQVFEGEDLLPPPPPAWVLANSQQAPHENSTNDNPEDFLANQMKNLSLPIKSLSPSHSNENKADSGGSSSYSVLQLSSPRPFVATSSDVGQLPQYSSPLSANSSPISPTKGLFDRHVQRVNAKGGDRMAPKPREGYLAQAQPVQHPYIAHKDAIIAPTGYCASADDVNIHLPSESEPLPPLSQSDVECQYCTHQMQPGDVAVICERAGPEKFWHPKCFVCVTCKELLVDLIYFYKDGQVYCGRHYAQAADIPRCKACDELIFGDSWTRADGCDWHVNHFCCFMCDVELAGSKYVPDDKEFPHCLSCYMTFKSKMCETCENKIPPTDTRTGYNGYFFHATPSCFRCYRCSLPLIGRKFKMAKNWLFCSANCLHESQLEIQRNPNPMKKEV